MSQHPPKEVKPATKKLRGQQRQTVVAALLASGMTQQAVADELNLSRATIARDVEVIKPDVQVAKTILERMQARIEELIPPEARVDSYVEMLKLAKETKQPSAGVQILARLDALHDVTTASERLRAKANEPPQIVPMFALPEGTTVQVSVTTTPTGSGLTSKEDVITQARDVTPTKQSE